MATLTIDSPKVRVLLLRRKLRLWADVIEAAKLLGCGGESSVDLDHAGWVARLNGLKDAFDDGVLPVGRLNAEGNADMRSLVAPIDLCRLSAGEYAGGEWWDWLRDVCKAWAAINDVDYEEISRAPSRSLSPDSANRSDGKLDLSPREKRKKETAAKWKEWGRLAVVYLKADRKRTHGKLAELVAKETKADTQTVRRRLPPIGVLREQAKEG